jgi:hypothetical protein
MPVNFQSLFVLLNGARLPYVVTGGLAVLLHGIDRLTADIDIAIDLRSTAPLQLAALLTDAGYRPMAPVDARDLANEALRTTWMSERGMKVFSFWDQSNLRPTLDVMLDNPVPFPELLAGSIEVNFRDTPIRVAGIAELIRMKRYAGRPQDLADIARLETILSAGPKP